MKHLAVILPLFATSLLATSFAANAQVYLVTPLANGGVKATSIQGSAEKWYSDYGYTFKQSATQKDKASVIILEKGKAPRLSYDSLVNIDNRYGGDGIVNIEGKPTNLNRSGDDEMQPGQTDTISLDGIPESPKDIPETFDDIPVQVPIELFEDAKSNNITLKNGSWRSEMTFNFEDGCPPQLAPMLRNMIGKGATTQAKFSNPYHPTDFSDELNNITWKRVTTNGYVSEPFNPTGGTNMPPGMSFSILYAMQAVSPEKVNVWVQVNLTLPEMMAAMVGGNTNCIAEANGNYAYIGD